MGTQQDLYRHRGLPDWTKTVKNNLVFLAIIYAVFADYSRFTIVLDG